MKWQKSFAMYAVSPSKKYPAIFSALSAKYGLIYMNKERKKERNNVDKAKLDERVHLCLFTR